jgi:hypothetical protein
MQGDSEAVAELKRRESFSKRELRAIRKEKARSGISVEALECAIGMPDRNVMYLPLPGTEQIEIYRYSLPGSFDLTVRVSDEGGQSIVTDVINSRPVFSQRNDPGSFPSSPANIPWQPIGRDDVDLQRPEWDTTRYLDPFHPAARSLLSQIMGGP